MPAANKLTPEARARETFTRWLADGSTWIGVFENADLGSPDIGRRVAFAYSTDCLEKARVGHDRAPDSPALGLGWRYLLRNKCLTVDEAIEAMRFAREE